MIFYLYTSDTSEFPQTVEMTGYRGPFNPEKAGPKYVLSTLKARLPASRSKTMVKVSGTEKLGLGYGLPAYTNITSLFN